MYGNEQHKTTFYGKVAKYFTDHKTDSTLKFVGSLAKIEAKNERGTTAHNKIEKAKELFKEIHGSVFQFEHCWKILKDFPK
ncbi:hypothetical protein CFP56_016221 [Quercus suber]|uniref:Uncharacterized protein n=1 Tax=Quercus suber TaxID=58331 RepID=A0AAW0KQL1_QUESU